MVDILDEYETDVFDDFETEIPVKRPRTRKSTVKRAIPNKTRATAKKVPKAAQEMQRRYDAIADDPNATKEQWKEFYQSIEKFIMTHACKINFNHYIDKNSDLWGYLTWTLMECIKPKKNWDGTRSCWYIDPFNHKIKDGYQRDKTNIGNYLLNKIKWLVIGFNNAEAQFVSYCTDLNADPLPDEKGQDFEVNEQDIYSKLPNKLEIQGQTDEFRKELDRLWNLRTLSTLAS